MRYIIVAPEQSTSKLRAESINRELYKISRPNWSEQDITKYFLSMFDNGLETCFGFEDTDFLPVNSEMNVEVLKDILSEDILPEEEANLELYLQSKIGSTVFFKDLVPSAMNIYTYEEMQVIGWFNEEDI